MRLFLNLILIMALQAQLGTSSWAEISRPAPQPHSSWSFTELGKIPVQSGGRIKPLDSFARETLLFETGSRAFEGWKPLDLLLSWVTQPHFWERKAFILIARQDVKRQLALDEKRTLFSPSELLNNSILVQYADQLAGVAPKGSEPPGGMPKTTPREKELRSVLDRISLFQTLVMGEGWRLIPKDAPAAWGGLLDFEKGKFSETIRTRFIEMVRGYQSEDFPLFEKGSRELRQSIENQIPDYSQNLEKQVVAETFLNQLRPFLIAWICYLLAAVLWTVRIGLGSQAQEKAMPTYVKGVEKSAVVLTAIGILSHVVGFGLRCFIAGRPPVTNMYESVIWVSLGVVFFALILYRMHRQMILLAVATTLAGLGLISGDASPAILDPSLSPLVPVLRSNYWLTVHVLTITLSYAAFALTFGLANIALFQFLKNAKAQKTNALNLLTYRSMQFGVVLIAAGTILGGIWADYSWGRFWGWDPKEVWALITLLCYLTILHGRFAGWVTPFGFSVWSAVSFLSVIMAWYGVNFILGVGLHSYGFSTGGTPWIVSFVAVEMVYILGVTAVVMRRRRLARHV